MFQYCPKCQHLIAKVEPAQAEKTETKTCQKCGHTSTFVLRYKAIDSKKR